MIADLFDRTDNAPSMMFVAWFVVFGFAWYCRPRGGIKTCPPGRLVSQGTEATAIAGLARRDIVSTRKRLGFRAFLAAYAIFCPACRRGVACPIAPVAPRKHEYFGNAIEA